MKSKLFYILTLLSIIIIFTGCSNEKNNSESSQNDEIPEMLEVQINLDTDNPQPNQEVTISALVTQGDEKVDDADEVLFEVWKNGKEEHEKIEGEHKGNGVYSISKSFPEEGVYYVISHVTARDMHNMPKREFKVGDNSNDETQATHQEHNDSHIDDLMIHFMSDDSVKVKDKTILTAHLQKENLPLIDAEVRFEIWKGEGEKHEFIDAVESKDGEYKAETAFESTGKYHVKIHVKKGELHTHQENSIEVQ
ncbi:FixH family protein [Neobacillus vireti]|uniref:YtkA-like domain-containing protein n=1 Tax=Neobacillus vireti LMG 21834 TaxID=1131730 RepID=A0AB94IH30_9BACI|nr:FixH family protein [Neobacillus vireti]ETI66423.1 hypothetical protein BAVI_22648 [Neobacillus vireti LMG 21834]KLT16081.1 hypothetical protein AA980_20190 [Neobacillus vireti]